MMVTQWACLQGHAAAAEDRQRIEGLIHEKAFLEGRLKEIVATQQGSAADSDLVKVCGSAQLPLSQSTVVAAPTHGSSRSVSPQHLLEQSLL